MKFYTIYHYTVLAGLPHDTKRKKKHNISAQTFLDVAGDGLKFPLADMTVKES